LWQASLSKPWNIQTTSHMINASNAKSIDTWKSSVKAQLPAKSVLKSTTPETILVTSAMSKQEYVVIQLSSAQIAWEPTKQTTQAVRYTKL